MPARDPLQKPGRLKAGTRDRTSPYRVARTSLEAEAIRLRRDGHGFDEIAEILNLDSEQKAYYLVTAALERKGKPEANDLREQMIDRLDVLFNRAVRIAKSDASDRVSAINAAVSVANRISALTGIDAPKQIDLKDDRQLPPDAATRSKFLEKLAEEARREEQAGG